MSNYSIVKYEYNNGYDCVPIFIFLDWYRTYTFEREVDNLQTLSIDIPCGHGNDSYEEEARFLFKKNISIDEYDKFKFMSNFQYESALFDKLEELENDYLDRGSETSSDELETGEEEAEEI